MWLARGPTRSTLLMSLAVSIYLGSFAVAQVSEGDPDALYRQREDPASVARAIELWSAHGPSDFEAAWKLARAYYWLGTRGPKNEQRQALQRGIETGERATTLAPQRPEGHFWLAADMGRLAESFGVMQGIKYRGRIRDELERSIAVAPGWQGGSAETALGQWYAEVPRLAGGNHKKAEEYFRRALGYEAENKQTLLYLGDLLADEGRRDEARKLWEKVTELPIDPEWEPEDRELQKEAVQKLRR